MKKFITLLLCITLFVFNGCTSKKPATPKPPVEATDPSHITAEDKGFVVSTSREVRNMTQMIKPTTPGNDVLSVLVKIENNSKSDFLVSPDFVTLKTDDGSEYKYSSQLTNSQPLGKSAFSKRPIPPDYMGGGLLIFEVKAGSKADSLNYKDDSGHNMTLKFATQTKSNV